jgi:hypothetical protein
MKQASLVQKISNDLNISIMITGPEYNLVDPVWAINWFNVKSKWLYDLYNYMARSHVISVSGYPFFKGRLIRRIEGFDIDERELLLIVNYPSPSAFLKMVKSKLFQLKSIIRISAVKDFTFGFMCRQDDGDTLQRKDSNYERNLIYMVHHFKNNNTEVDALKIKEKAASFDIFTHFIGAKSHIIGQIKNSNRLKTAPFIMDGLIVLGAFEESQFQGFLNSPFYQKFISEKSSNYLGLFAREL